MKFYSLKYRELIVTVDPKTFTVDSGFRVTRGMMGLYPQGLSITFKNLEFDTKSLNFSFGEEQKLIKILKRHPSYGVSFIAEDHDESDPEVAEKVASARAEKAEAAEKAADTNHETPVNKTGK